MELFSQFLSIVLTGVMGTLVGLFLTYELSALLRRAFGFRDPGLGWSPAAGLDPHGFRSTRRTPNLSAFDFPQGLYRD